MIQLYKASGAGGFTVQDEALGVDQTQILFDNAARLLIARGHPGAAQLLRSVPFKIVSATNDFNDDFSILYATVALQTYERLRVGAEDARDRQAFRQIAEVITEIGTYIRFIAVEMQLDASMTPTIPSGHGLTPVEIKKLVYKYIGVSGGYLGDFSYRSHHDFYIDLDLDIDPYTREGTTRERFIGIISESSPDVQRRILQGILKRFPVDGSDLRTPERAAEIRGWIDRLGLTDVNARIDDKHPPSDSARPPSATTVASPSVFICYAKQDADKAALLFDYLHEAGASPWMDKRKLYLGDDWEHEIKKAVAAADAFVVCLRPGFDAIGFRQKEVHWALDALRLRPPGVGFVIPCVVAPCNLPEWCQPFHAGSDLSQATSFAEVVRAIEKHTYTRLRGLKS